MRTTAILTSHPFRCKYDQIPEMASSTSLCQRHYVITSRSLFPCQPRVCVDKHNDAVMLFTDIRFADFPACLFFSSSAPMPPSSGDLSNSNNSFTPPVTTPLLAVTLVDTNHQWLYCTVRQLSLLEWSCPRYNVPRSKSTLQQLPSSFLHSSFWRPPLLQERNHDPFQSNDCSLVQCPPGRQRPPGRHSCHTGRLSPSHPECLTLYYSAFRSSSSRCTWERIPLFLPTPYTTEWRPLIRFPNPKIWFWEGLASWCISSNRTGETPPPKTLASTQAFWFVHSHSALHPAGDHCASSMAVHWDSEIKVCGQKLAPLTRF